MGANTQAVEPAGTDPPEDRVRRLPPLYYLHNFRLALQTLEGRYVGLLSDDEAAFIQRFKPLPEPAQCLLTRLVMRKGPLFRRATLAYAEVPDLDQAIRELAAPGWLDPDPQLSADELSRVLTSEELRLAAGIARGRRTTSRPTAFREPQLALPLPEQPTPHRCLADWNVRLDGAVVHLRLNPLLHRLQLLFFGNPHQTWAEFVLTDLGVKRYERVVLDDSAKAFHSREEIEHFYRLHDCRARLDAGEPASVVRDFADVPQTVSGWLRDRFRRLNIRIGEAFQAEGNVALALQYYRGCGAAEGRVRALRLQLRLGLLADARCDAHAALELPCREAQREVIDRALLRIHRREGGAKVKRAMQAGSPVIDLRLPQPQDRRRIELSIVEHLSGSDCQLFYVENSLLTSLFGLLFWDVLFAPVQGAFFHPFQSAPADLHTAEFRERRAPRIEAALSLLDTGEYETVIWRLYRAKAGLFNAFVRWRKVRPPLLRLALQCIPASHLRLCFERLLDDLQENTTGMPDLVQFWPQERRYRLIEVKGPGDRLQNNQRRWLRFFERHGIPAAVCKVQWQSQ